MHDIVHEALLGFTWNLSRESITPSLSPLDLAILRLFVMLTCTNLQPTSVTFVLSRTFFSYELLFIPSSAVSSMALPPPLPGGHKRWICDQAEPFLETRFGSWRRKNVSLLLNLGALMSQVPRALSARVSLRSH